MDIFSVATLLGALLFPAALGVLIWAVVLLARIDRKLTSVLEREKNNKADDR